jgi:hypothetical protein
LEVLELLVPRPWFTARVTAAVLQRKIDAEAPTLLLDESDAAFGGEREYAEALRGILNTGHRRGGKSSMMIGKGAEMGYKDFQTFCPKAIAGLGKLPDTVSDRAIAIVLKRKAPGEEHVERFRRRVVEPEVEYLREGLAAWAESQLASLRDSRPDLPETLNDRQQDGVEPLLAVADAAGAEWPVRALEAIVEVLSGASSDDSSIGVKALTDCRAILDDRDTDKMSSAELVDALWSLETSPWSEFGQGKPLTKLGLSRLLRRFEIFPRTIREGGITFKYLRESFADAWLRYLGPPSREPARLMVSDPSHPTQTTVHVGEALISDPSQRASVTSEKSEESPAFAHLVTAVTDRGTHRDLLPKRLLQGAL